MPEEQLRPAHGEAHGRRIATRLWSLRIRFRSLFKQTAPARTQSPEAIAAHIRKIVEHPPSDANLSSFAPDARAAARLLDHVCRARAAFALNLLYLRAMSDISAFPVLHAFLREVFQEPEEVADFDRLLTEIEQRLRAGSVGAAAMLDPRLARELDQMICASDLFETLTSFMDQTFGFSEPAARENFDEHSYLAANPDVAAAVARGEIRSGRAHFVEHGEKEGRAQRRFSPKPGEAARELIYPIAFCRHSASSTGVGALRPGAQVDRNALLSAPLDDPFAVSLVTEWEEHNAAPAFLIEKTIGEGSEKSRALRSNLAWIAPPIYLAAFSDACADIENGVVMFDRDKAWGDSCFATILTAGGRRRSPDVLPLAGRYARVRRPDEEASLQTDIPLMLCCSWASRCNYGHWLMNSLLSIYLVLDELKFGRLRLLCPSLTERQRSEILAVGVPAGAIVESDARYVRCKRLIYPSPLATLANMSPSAISVEFLAYVAERLRPAEKRPGAEHVFLSRMGFPSARRMSNEKELAAALEKVGFVTGLTHEMSLGEQIGFMSNARLALGQFGAALWNVPFMPRGARVIEIATSNYLSNEYLQIARLCGHEFARIIVDASSPEDRAYEAESFAFQAPVDEIAAFARSLM